MKFVNRYLRPAYEVLTRPKGLTQYDLDRLHLGVLSKCRSWHLAHASQEHASLTIETLSNFREVQFIVMTFNCYVNCRNILHVGVVCNEPKSVERIHRKRSSSTGEFSLKHALYIISSVFVESVHVSPGVVNVSGTSRFRSARRL